MTAAGDRLRDYRSKRDFGKTSEPSGEGAGTDRGKNAPLFVVQEHAASTRHFDFRLQVGEVLKSWAVPKGPSTDPSEKRLAVPTEDHPLDYADYEGVIPEDQYGAGAVIVWDRGTYRNLKEEGVEDEGAGEGEGEGEGAPPSMDEALADGHATVWLEGEKLRGGYGLIRIENAEAWEDQRWLLVKMDDDEADARRNPVSTEPKSILSGRTVEEVAEEGEEKEP